MDALSRRRYLSVMASTVVGVGAAGCTRPVQLDMPSSELVGDPDDPQSGLTVYMYAPDNGGESGTEKVPYMFRPMVGFVERGTTIEWTHAGNEQVLHSSTAFAGASTDPRLIPTDAAGWNSGPFGAAKDPFSRTFDTPGVYVYYCMPHQDFAMAGILVVGDVEPGDPGWSPGMTEPVEPREVLSPRMTEKIGMLRGMVRDQYGTDARSTRSRPDGGEPR